MGTGAARGLTHHLLYGPIASDSWLTDLLVEGRGPDSLLVKRVCVLTVPHGYGFYPSWRFSRWQWGGPGIVYWSIIVLTPKEGTRTYPRTFSYPTGYGHGSPDPAHGYSKGRYICLRIISSSYISQVLNCQRTSHTHAHCVCVRVWCTLTTTSPSTALLFVFQYDNELGHYGTGMDSHSMYDPHSGHRNMAPHLAHSPGLNHGPSLQGHYPGYGTSGTAMSNSMNAVAQPDSQLKRDKDSIYGYVNPLVICYRIHWQHIPRPGASTK